MRPKTSCREQDRVSVISVGGLMTHRVFSSSSPDPTSFFARSLEVGCVGSQLVLSSSLRVYD